MRRRLSDWMRRCRTRISGLVAKIRRRKQIVTDIEIEWEAEIGAMEMITYQELQMATSNFNPCNVVGAGGSGCVYRGMLVDGTTVAVKKLDLKHDEACKRFDAEVEILRQVRHRNLVKVITTCSNEYFRAIVLQYMPNWNLDYWLYQRGNVLNLARRIEIMLDVAMAIDYLHNGYHEPVVHCDLKPANILLDEDMVAHVSDFGISKVLAQSGSAAQTMTLGTIGYIAPEYGSEGIVSTTGDVYSFGITLMEVLTRRKPTDEIFTENLSLRQWVALSYPNAILHVIDTNLLHAQVEITSRLLVCIDSLIRLALECTTESPEKRISMGEVVVRLTKIRGRFLGIR